MSGPLKPPPLLPLEVSRPLTRDCTRWLGDRNCGKPAVRHVIWDAEMENSFVCDEHLAEVGKVWAFYARHEVGPDCAMPGSEFFEEENVCRCPDELVAAPELLAVASPGKEQT